MNIIKNCVNLPEDINIIIDSIIKNFLSEIKLYFDKIRDLELFQFNERAFTGFLNNAIIRGNNSDEQIITIQEYCIKNKNKHKSGRPDLLYYDYNTNKCILFEAKQNYTSEKKDEKWNKLDTDKYLDKIIDQAENYYNYPEEKEFYSDKLVYLCAIVFDSVQIKSTVLEYIKKDDFSLSNYYSYTIYDENIKTNLLNIYGKIKMID